MNKRKLALVAENNPLQRDNYCVFLKDRGFRTRAATTVDEAKEFISRYRNQIRLIFVNYHLTDGEDVCDHSGLDILYHRDLEGDIPRILASQLLKEKDIYSHPPYRIHFFDKHDGLEKLQYILTTLANL